MEGRQRGTLIFTGATASVRGSAGHCAFSGAMMAKRALAQSLARELGPRGVHVSHVIVDGAVDNPNTRRFFSEKNPDFLREFDKKLKVDGLIQPASVAELYLQIHNQVQ